MTTLPTNYQDTTTPTGDLTEFSADHATRGLNRITEQINANTADITTNTDDIYTATAKLAGIEENADVTDAANVEAAGAVMEADTSTANMNFVVDEDTMSSDSATKIPTQQSVKAYVDGSAAVNSTTVDAAGAVMNADTSTAGMSFVVDEDTMSSNSATKVPSQQSVKAYVDNNTAVNSTTVNAAGAVMETDTSTASMSFVVDEDTMTSNSATKVPTQQSVKAYVDNNAAVNSTTVNAAGAVMEADTTTASMSFVVDEDNMASNLATKVPTQQSVKAYVDGTSGGSLPSQTGNSGKYLTTNGSTASWDTVSSTAWAEIDLTKAPYNADPTGVVDTAAIAMDAINDYQGKCVVFLPPGTYKWSTSLSSGYPVHIRGAGIGITTIMHDPDAAGIFVVGSAGSTYTLSANITAGAVSFTVSNASGIAAGDILNIRSLKIWPPSGASGSQKEGKYGELVQVASVASNTVTCTGFIAYDYATADTVTIEKQNLVNGSTIQRMSVQNSAPDTAGAAFITFRRARRCLVRDIEFRYLDDAAIYGHMCWGLTVDNCHFRDGSQQTPSRLSYGVAMYEASRDWHVSNCTQIGGRHMFMTGAYGAGGTTSYGVPRSAVISNCIGRDSYEACFDTHEEGDEITFQNCMAINSRNWSFQIRAPRTRLIGCSSSGQQVSVIVRRMATDFHICDFSAYEMRQGGAGNSAVISVDDNATYGVIDGVYVDGCDHAAILVQTGVAPLVIRNVTARNYARNAVGHGAVEFVGTSSGHVIQNVVATGNAAKPAIYGPATVTGVTASGVEPRDGAAYTGGGLGITSLVAKVAVPANAGAYGQPGMFASDANYYYACTAANTWRRVAIASW